MSHHYFIVALGSLGIVALAVWIIHLFAQHYRDVSLVGLAAAFSNDDTDPSFRSPKTCQLANLFRRSDLHCILGLCATVTHWNFQRLISLALAIASVVT